MILMIVVGSDLAIADFRRVVHRPRVLLAGLLLPPLFLPPMAFGLILALSPPPEVASGLLLVAACPVGGISNAYVYLARGSAALSVTLTTFSCLLAFATVPASSSAFGAALHRPFVMQAPTAVLLGQLLLMVALPTWIGLACRSRWPSVVERWQPRLWPVPVGLLVLLMVVTISIDVDGFLAIVPQAGVIGSLFLVCSLVTGWAVATVLGGDRRERVTLAVEFATRNIAVATTIAITVMGKPKFATFGVAYFLAEMPWMALVAWVARRREMVGEVKADVLV